MTFDYTRYTIFQGSWVRYWTLSGCCRSCGKIGNK